MSDDSRISTITGRMNVRHWLISIELYENVYKQSDYSGMSKGKCS